jgi:hypothetical protein
MHFIFSATGQKIGVASTQDINACGTLISKYDICVNEYDICVNVSALLVFFREI